MPTKWGWFVTVLSIWMSHIFCDGRSWLSAGWDLDSSRRHTSGHVWERTYRGLFFLLKGYDPPWHLPRAVLLQQRGAPLLSPQCVCCFYYHAPLTSNSSFCGLPMWIHHQRLQAAPRHPAAETHWSLLLSWTEQPAESLTPQDETCPCWTIQSLLCKSIQSISFECIHTWLVESL